MKYLQDYKEQAQTDLFRETGTFFAFSDSQFNEQKVDGVEYVNCGAGCICPKENVKTLLDGLGKIQKEAIAQDIAENGKEKIIERELYNHEAFYTGRISETLDEVKQYGFTREDVIIVWNKIVEKYSTK